ncbi:glycosyltransferase family 4 protein [Klenkia brasiliensis]|uniref:Glycosyltransferase involved in cell wall bisynthesis n=1 Tax=Klenkia brasiliensis TaxID=333142 RepID=A0A1G7RH31_9ACTN|nr:glycosyltransferase family 4 protein [Klenkia brasiliensis]SDG09449.1 Glycosyltransferase involved in cell wall bisynthesis [Klenkia brasiliensis]
MPDHDLLIALNYYAPYVSGLTNVARDVAVELTARGHRVKVVTSRHDPALPEHEVLEGVEVERAPVVARVGKGVISPALVTRAVAASRRARLTNLHLPMLEAGVIARAAGSPVAVTYHCDVSLPPGAVNALQRTLVDASSRLALRRSRDVVVTSDDYAQHSRLWPAMRGRTVAIPPPCHERPAGTPRFRDGAGLHVGFLGRIVEEKGLQYLVRGFQALDDPDSRLLIGGDFSNVAGGSVVDEVRALVDGDPRVRLLGFLADEDIADLYASLDVFALPSVNAFEAFGIVQVEAMLAGVPALASDLPGVRTPVQRTGFGRVVTPRDVEGITAALASLAADPGDRPAGAQRARELYSIGPVIDAYEALLRR